MKIRLNPNEKVRKAIEERIRKNDGYCPCRFEKNEDTKCPCKEFRETGKCICGLYIGGDNDGQV